MLNEYFCPIFISRWNNAFTSCPNSEMQLIPAVRELLKTLSGQAVAIGGSGDLHARVLGIDLEVVWTAGLNCWYILEFWQSST